MIQQKECGVSSERDRVLERANALQIQSFSFTVTMTQTCISKSYLVIPLNPARSYFRVMGSNNIILRGEDGRNWPMKYTVGSYPQYQVCLISGWKKISRENHLRKGDRCGFELLSNTHVIFNVTIDRITNDAIIECNKNGPLEVMNDVASPSTNRAPRVTSIAMKSVKPFEFENPPFFTIRMTSYYVSEKPKVHIPCAHARKYLKQDKHGDNVIVLHGSNGKAWPVQFHNYKRSFIEKVELYKGWKNFTLENRVRVGDTSVFKLVNGKPREYNVTIFPIAN